MNENIETKPENPPPNGEGKIKFLLLALAPMPIGFLFGPAQLLNYAQGHRTGGSSPTYIFVTLTLVLCILGAVGMFGGFEKGNWGARVGGVIVGVILCGLELSLIIFIGCCAGLSQLGPT
jgi:hypothetical protein